MLSALSGTQRQAGQMEGTRAQQLSQGWSGACLLAALLICFSLLPLHAQDYMPPQRAPLTVYVWPIPKGPQAQQNGKC